MADDDIILTAELWDKNLMSDSLVGVASVSLMSIFETFTIEKNGFLLAFLQRQEPFRLGTSN